MLASKVNILNQSQTPPFVLDDETISEAVRLEYRFIDLRREVMQKNLKIRHNVSKSVRNFLDLEGFIELDDEKIPVRPMTAVLIKPGCRHRAVGEMRIINIPIPAFDPKDEWFD